MTKEIFDSLGAEEKKKLVFDLANFLREVHAAVLPEEARKLGVKDEDAASYSRLVKSVLMGGIGEKTVSDFVDAMVKEYEEMIREKGEMVFLYNDLHTENMAFDAEAKRLNGVFDFGDVRVEDVCMDFCHLYKFDPGLMKAVAEKYGELTGRRLSLRRMVMHGRIQELADLAEFIDRPESTVYRNALMRIEKWSGEMDLFK